MANDMENIDSMITAALGRKPNCTITSVTSVTGGVINSQTINIEYSSDENELVAKTFSTVDALTQDAKNNAKKTGHTTSIDELIGNTDPDAVFEGSR